MNSRGIILVLAGVTAVAGGVLAVKLTPPARPTARARAVKPSEAPAGASAINPEFVGRAVCIECHEDQDALWRGSHHDQAMMEATPDHVRGDFADASFDYHGVRTTFFRRGEEFFARTDGPDGALHDYKIAYTFGIHPLQQYLIEFPGGRFQALNVCWDARPKDQGGQRWFHLYPDENVTSQDILHWTGPYQNWNHMCAECHSTGVHKNYDPQSARFNTTWKELDVSCEACHGPASEHVAWARRNASSRKEPAPAGGSFGLLARLREDTRGMWLPDPATGIANRDHPRTSQAEINTCARCHSRRGAFSEDVLPGRPPSDTHRLALLEPTLYEADGQIKDEVYEYGSFLQSRMFAAGVTCSDCHDPHSLKTAPGNSACARCHAPEKFDTREHHFHTPGTKGSACVECHMPTRNYMVVHARHDHSLRVPRPDLSVSIGIPNACNGCHADRTAQWAADEIARRTPGKAPRPHFGTALAAGRRGDPGAEALLTKLLADASQPGIARATAADMLTGIENPAPLVAALNDPDPLVRGAAINALTAAAPSELSRWLAPLLSDPVRQLRMDAARRLVPVPDSLLSADERSLRSRAMDEFLAAQRLDSDRAEAHLNLGALHVEQDEPGPAEREYLEALRLSPRFPAAYVNLADLYRALGREPDAVRVLRDGLTLATGSADVPHALGLALVRDGRLDEALPLLERAARLAPDVTRYAYVYAVALESAGPPGRGLDVLKLAHEKRPNDAEVLSALVAYCHQVGRLDDAVLYARRLAQLRPRDPEVRRLVDDLNAQRAGAGRGGPQAPEPGRPPAR